MGRSDLVNPLWHHPRTMRSYKNHLLIVLAVVAVGLAALAWQQHRELVALRATTLPGAGNADWQKRMASMPKRARSPGGQATSRPGGPVATAVPGTTSGPTPGGGPGNMAAGFTSFMERPEAARLLAIQQKAQIDARYAVANAADRATAGSEAAVR